MTRRNWSRSKPREAAILWILKNQAGRRNLKPDQMSFLRGKRYNLEKKPEGRPTKKLRQNGGETAKRLAEEYKVDRRTIERDGQYAAAVDTNPTEEICLKGTAQKRRLLECGTKEERSVR